MKKIIFIIILIFTLILAGCGNNKEENSKSGSSESKQEKVHKVKHEPDKDIAKEVKTQFIDNVNSATKKLTDLTNDMTLMKPGISNMDHDDLMVWVNDWEGKMEDINSNMDKLKTLRSNSNLNVEMQNKMHDLIGSLGVVVDGYSYAFDYMKNHNGDVLTIVTKAINTYITNTNYSVDEISTGLDDLKIMEP
ncbi:hypothetical protein GMB86_11905 [Terrilactibacillus sp. BCM23-1]|uniref:Lipoprotein n=1 Tax=Terrilactibacillus tamarindi TaxID=2599694 RepID=A0A6N8CRN3_9BACI|nr:hypothetical protein [Terrilactibacillus tamarindi]MTT32711.1 hypothetical protein [Terrilactibacillus tamarindi]